jgi:hypothetical protein
MTDAELKLQAHIRAERATLKRHGTLMGYQAEHTYKTFYLYYMGL